MKKLITLLLILVSSIAYADVENPTEWTEDDGSPSVFNPWKVSVSNGTLTDNGDGSVSLSTGGGGGGSGDITSVGDVASGAAFDGTQGTTLTFNNAGGDGVLDYDGTDFGMTKPLDVTGTGTFSGNITGAIIQSRRASGLTNFSLYSTTNAAEEWILYLSGEDMRFYEGGGGGDRWTMEKGGNFGNTTNPDRPLDVANTGSTTPTARLRAGSAGWGRILELFDASASYYNWIIGAQNNLNNGIEFTPSTALGGTTYSTPSWSIFTTSVRAGDSTNGTTISTTTGITYAGTARPTASIYIPVTAGTCRTTNGCADPVKSETATNFVQYYSSSFAADADDFWQAAIKLPSNYDGGTFTARFEWTGTTEASATVVWGAQAVCLSDDDALDTAFGTAQTVSDDVTVTGDYQVTSETSAITAGGTCVAGDRMWLQGYRDPDNASDDATNPAKLIGIYLTYTRISESTND